MIAKALAPFALVLAVGCGGVAGGGGSSSLTVDKFKEGVYAYTGEYAKTHNNANFGECPTKDEFIAKIGKPDSVSEVGDDVYMYYKCKDGMALVRVNKGVYSAYKRINVHEISQVN